MPALGGAQPGATAPSKVSLFKGVASCADGQWITLPEKARLLDALQPACGQLLASL